MYQPDDSALAEALAQVLITMRVCYSFRESTVSNLESMEDLFTGRHSERDVIILCVRWYLRYKLSLRDLVEMMAERGCRWLTPRSCVG